MDNLKNSVSKGAKQFLKEQQAEKMQVVTIELKQGDNTPLRFSTELTQGLKNDEVSGTLAHRIISLKRKAKKYKMNLGFSFARKFDVKISIGGVCADGKNTLMRGAVEFGLTIQNNEESENRFHDFVKELTDAILTGEDQAEGTFAELMAEVNYN